MTLINDRAESIPPLGCDVVLSRVTGPLRKVLRQLARHRAEDGTIVFFKSEDSLAEFEQYSAVLEKLGLAVKEVRRLELPVSGIPRRFVVLG